MGIDLISLAVFAIVLIAIWMIVSSVPIFAPFKNILLIVLAAIAAIFLLLRVIAPLLGEI